MLDGTAVVRQVERKDGEIRMAGKPVPGVRRIVLVRGDSLEDFVCSLPAITAVREAYQIITGAGAEIAGLVISLDRQERGQGAYSAVQELKQSLGIPVISIVQLDDLIDILEESSEYEQFLNPVLAYRKQYGVIS